MVEAFRFCDWVVLKGLEAAFSLRSGLRLKYRFPKSKHFVVLFEDCLKPVAGDKNRPHEETGRANMVMD